MSDGDTIYNKSNMNLEEALTDEKNKCKKSKKNSTETTKVSDGDESRSCSFNDEDYVVFCFDDDGGLVLEEINKKNGKLPPDGGGIDIKEITEVEDTSTKWMTLPPSISGSMRSNSSSSSFAFPVMNWEMKGSPERMPKLDECRKERPPESEEERRLIGWRNIRFLCCRF